MCVCVCVVCVCVCSVMCVCVMCVLCNVYVTACTHTHTLVKWCRMGGRVGADIDPLNLSVYMRIHTLYTSGKPMTKAIYM